MSLNKLIGGDCGGNNSLVQLSNIVSRDVSLSQPVSQSDTFVNEFLAHNSQTPQTFNMNSLLNNLPEENIQNSQHIQASSSQLNLSNNTSWRPRAGPSYMPMQPMIHPFHMQPQHRQPQSSNIQIQYIDESDVASTTQNNLQAKAQEYVDTVGNDDEEAYSQFMSFMKKVSAGELNLGEAEQTGQRKMSQDEMLGEMAEKFKDEWDKLSHVTDYWNSEAANGISKEYTFTEGNIMLENKSALEIGKEKLKMGDIPGAVLCFEAAAQQEPNSAEPWFLLGTTQAENEQDPLAITALKKSLEINPLQLEAYIVLAAAYTNENMPKYAFNSLLNWLKTNPKYNDLSPQDINPKELTEKELQKHVNTLLLRAAQLNPSQIDPDVQNALGVVYNIGQEYEKAVDCFQTALMVDSENAKLWNRLGATLANSDRSEDAVEAYHRALNLEPGFIRARYNVGITCMNLGAHRQAAEHFLVALNLQTKAKSMFPDSSADSSSSTIWTTLRMVCSFMGEHEVAKLVDDKNISELNKFFELE